MFTVKSIFLLIAVVVLLAIAWNTDITMVYILFVVAFVIFFLSFMHLKLTIPDVAVRREMRDVANEDEILNVQMELQNKRGLSSYFFELIDRFPGAPPDEEEKSLFVLNMKPREIKRVSYVANCYRRGLWRLGPISIISQDALGFFRTKKDLKVFSEIVVYPALFKIFAFPPLASGSVSWMGVETASISGETHEFFGVREYQRGDMMSRIHWPSSARQNKLIVKQFERNAVQEATIVIDLKKGHDIGSGKETTLEYAVKIAGSVARYLLRGGAFVQMVGYAKEALVVPFGKGEWHNYKILDYLAMVQANGDFTLGQVLDEAVFLAPHRSTLILIMLDTDMDALTRLVQYKVKAVKLIVVVLTVSSFGQLEEGEYLDIEGARKFDEALLGLEAYVYRITKGDDLEKKFEAI